MGDLELKYVNGEIRGDKKKKKKSTNTIWRNLTRTKVAAMIRQFYAGRMSFSESFICDRKN